QITSTALNTANEEIFFLLLLLIIFCLFIPYIISQSLVNPLRHIMSDLAKFKEENYEFLSNHDLYIDEYAKLSEALSTAGASITKAKNEIIEKNKSLREKVVLLTEARNTADEANSRKDVFVKNMTHELKTPLSGAISGNDLLENYLYELLSMLDSEEVIESKLYKMRESIFNCIRFVDISNRGISQVNSLVDNILLSIQDISENIYIQNSPNDIYTSLQGLYEYYKEVCEQKNIEFVYKNNIKENIYIICDWGRLSQILNSLLSNAVKFTTHGYVKFIVIFSYRVNSIDVKFEISDSGIGISDKEKIYIFDLFQIAQSPENKFSSGIGTGLSTSKRLAESMGGKIYLKDSKIGVGTTFLFECELPVCDENTNSVNSFLVNKNNYSFSVLYVEDSYLNQTIFKEYCNEYGVDLMLAHDGKEGFEKYKLTIFNIIVIDCYMPVMNGFQLIKKIRDHESANNLEPSYIVALTADNSDQNRLRCQKYGFDLFITKPYNRHHFKQILSKGKNLK
ncbi:MAG: signal transduction histidine kinase/ActR/RegA family two-component response regulator, partial [Cellvibrionaceae bacterium]